VYGDGCKNEFLCPFSHGWKEQEYHPKNYKLNACRNDTQCSKAHCPYFHTDSQKRSQVPDGFKLQPRNRGAAFSSNEYMADFIHNQASILLPQRSKIYHPSTAPFVNSDTFMRQPYYIIHASLGFKDQTQFSYYLSGHAEEQQEYKQMPQGGSKGKMTRTFSQNSQMNAASSVPFYPGKGKVVSKPVMHQLNSYKDMNKKFPTSVSHGMIAGMSSQQMQPNYGPPPGLEGSMMSQQNMYRAPMENAKDNNWNRQPSYGPEYQQYSNPGYMGWQGTGSQMIPSALQSQHHPPVQNKPRKMGNIKGSMSTQFQYNLGSQLLKDEDDNKFCYGFFDNNSDSDGDNFNPSRQE
jgi:hypothetical protein